MTRLFLRLPLHRLVIGPDHEPGLDLEHVAALAEGAATDERPILVAPIIGTSPPLYAIRNGRHRYLAAQAAGLAEVLVEVTLPDPGDTTGPPPRAG